MAALEEADQIFRRLRDNHSRVGIPLSTSPPQVCVCVVCVCGVCVCGVCVCVCVCVWCVWCVWCVVCAGCGDTEEGEETTGGCLG